jgi:hypothetical protein
MLYDVVRGCLHTFTSFNGWCQAREQNTFLARFVGDWATKEIVKQFLKNKRRNHYRNGWLDVPDKYGYLKSNASMRDPTASRRKRALLVTAAAKDLQDATLRKGKKIARRPRVVEDDDSGEDNEDEQQEEPVDDDA